MDDPNLIFEFDMNDYDTDSDWFCDEGHSHPHITYYEMNGDPCPWVVYDGFDGGDDEDA